MEHFVWAPKALNAMGPSSTAVWSEGHDGDPAVFLEGADDGLLGPEAPDSHRPDRG